MTAHHVAIKYVDEYLEVAGIAGDKKGPLFRSSGQGRRQDALLRKRMTPQTALKMIKRRALEMGLPTDISNHSFRGTGITEYLRNGGELEIAARIAGMMSPSTNEFLIRRTTRILTCPCLCRAHLNINDCAPVGRKITPNSLTIGNPVPGSCPHVGDSTSGSPGHPASVPPRLTTPSGTLSKLRRASSRWAGAPRDLRKADRDIKHHKLGKEYSYHTVSTIHVYEIFI